MFGFLGRLVGQISFSSIVKNFDIDVKPLIDEKAIYAVVAVHIFGRKLLNQRFVLFDFSSVLETVLDIDLVKKPAGEFLRVRFELMGRPIFDDTIKLSSSGSEEPAEKRTSGLRLDEPIDVKRSQQISSKELSKTLSEIAIINN